MKQEDIRAAFFSANLHQYLPDVPWEAHPAYFREYLRYHAPKPVHIQRSGRLRGFPLHSPGILVAFHLGDHTSLPVCLASLGVRFDMVIDRQIHERYARVLQQAGMQHGETSGEAVRFLFSEDRRLVYQIRDSLRSGRHILIFADGNGGQEQPEPYRDLLPVPFFSGTLWVKRGVAVLARLLGVPIYPFYGTEDADQPLFELSEPLMADPHLDRDIDARRILGRLYGLLQEQIAASPMRWECWTYLHLNGMLRIDKTTSVPSGQPDLGAAHMQRLLMDGRTCWLDKQAYEMYLIGKV